MTKSGDIGKLISVVIYGNKRDGNGNRLRFNNLKKGLTVGLIIVMIVTVVENIYSTSSKNI
ncbi:hypothetical protein FD25_GL001745 [Levilactobacillus acidifarinae DSM 19394]|uniref:Uncharacterized protein n=1 Tax=Levilactobacillus acidifarinae DSM 19394 = JCM 15949 TaxID=1423715 RepID=A0A0R1LV57_9LACO|nr:hypothetical protein FD25_GL001745 [Levilactobacillus acidifarinae DSM 19394]